MFGADAGQSRVFPFATTHSVFNKYPRCIPIVERAACSPTVVPLYVEGNHPVLAARIGAADIGVRDCELSSRETIERCIQRF